MASAVATLSIESGEVSYRDPHFIHLAKAAAVSVEGELRWAKSERFEPP